MGNGVSLFLPFDLKWIKNFLTLRMLGLFELFFLLDGFFPKLTLYPMIAPFDAFEILCI